MDEALNYILRIVRQQICTLKCPEAKNTSAYDCDRGESREGGKDFEADYLKNK